MSGGIGSFVGRTKNFGLKLVNFDFPRWHTEMWNTLKQIDAALALRIPGMTLTGAWENNIYVTIGEIYIDTEEETIWRVNTSHTTALNGTFAADRAAQPTRWARITNAPTFRGEWTADQVYNVGDIVSVGYAYYYCTASNPGSIITNLPANTNFWSLIWDATAAVQAANNADLSLYAAKAAANTFTNKQTFPAATTGRASINIPHGTQPTSPVDGDLWTTTAGFVVRMNGVLRSVAFLDQIVRYDLAQTLSTAQIKQANLNIKQGWRTLQTVLLGSSAGVIGFTLPSDMNVFRLTGRLIFSADAIPLLQFSENGGTSMIAGTPYIVSGFNTTTITNYINLSAEAGAYVGPTVFAGSAQGITFDIIIHKGRSTTPTLVANVFSRFMALAPGAQAVGEYASRMDSAAYNINYMRLLASGGASFLQNSHITLEGLYSDVI